MSKGRPGERLEVGYRLGGNSVLHREKSDTMRVLGENRWQFGMAQKGVKKKGERQGRLRQQPRSMRGDWTPSKSPGELLQGLTQGVMIMLRFSFRVT